LRATAKVALSMTIVGCAAQVHLDPADEDPTPEPETPASPDEPTPIRAVALSPNEELSCSAPAPGDEVTLDDEQLACCATAIADVAPPTGTTWDAWMASGMHDPEVQGCCSVLIAHADADWATVDEVSWDAFNACCIALDSQSGACTPWGPPVPPCVRRLPILEGLA
jgi:hypothetical protein